MSLKGGYHNQVVILHYVQTVLITTEVCELDSCWWQGVIDTILCDL